MRWLALVLLVSAGCSHELPDPQSAGAVTMRRYCASCHPVYAPSSMTFPMWEMQLDAMHRLFTQRGLAWPDASEEQVLRDYLRTHAAGG